jgi:hypothetical protein
LFARTTSAPVRRKPRLEALEDRLVLATFNVTSLLNDPFTSNPGPSTLR